MRESVDHTNREQVGHITANVWYIITREMTSYTESARFITSRFTQFAVWISSDFASDIRF